MAAVSAAFGRPFMPHQRYVVDVALEVQAEEAGDPEPGSWAYDDVGLTIERRGGKTSIITPVAVHRARLVKRAQMFLTAQTRDKARRRWMDVSDDVLHSVLRSDVRRKISQGFEELRWIESDSLLLPFAPNEDALHSETIDLVLIDELWAFDAEAARLVRAGYVPAMSTTDAQAWKMSTAGTGKSSWLNEVRAAGRAAVRGGVTLGTAYFEWSLPDRVGGVPVGDLDGDDLVEACIANHPAICHTPGCAGPRGRAPCPHGFTVRPASLRTAWGEMGRNAPEFLRAYGNRSSNDRAEEWRGVDRDVWLRRIDGEGIPTDARVQLGVWVDEDSEDAAVSAAWRSPDGVMRTELLRREVGTSWVAPFVEGVVDRQSVRVVAIGNVGASRDVAAELTGKLGERILTVSQADVAAACARHSAGMKEGRWVHRHSEDALAAAAAAVRSTGKSWTWAKDGVPVSGLGSMTLAGWAADHAPAESGFWIG